MHDVSESTRKMATAIGTTINQHFEPSPIDVLTAVEAMMELSGQLLSNRKDGLEMCMVRMASRAGYHASIELSTKQ